MIEEQEDIPAPEPKKFKSKDLASFALIKEGLAKFENEDPDLDRYT